MASRRTSVLDLYIGLPLLAASVALLAIASSRGASQFHFLPAMDGCLTVGVVGFGLVLAEGVPYRQAVIALLPVVAFQVLGAEVQHASLFAVLGIETAVFGLVGVLFGLHARRSLPPAPARPARRVMPMLPRPSHATAD